MKNIIKKITTSVIAISSAAFLVAGFAGLVLAFTSNGTGPSSNIKLTSTVVGSTQTKSISSKNGNILGTDIPRTVYMQDRLAAMAKVLNTSTTNIQTAIHNKTFKTLIKSANLSYGQFRKDVANNLVSDLKSAGYKETQIKLANKQMIINHLRHEIKKLKA